jgi:endonuclease III
VTRSARTGKRGGRGSDHAADTLRWASRVLKRRYRSPRHHNKVNPLDELVFILLSAKTTESSYLRTYEALRRRFADWFDVLRSPIGTVASTIREGGLSTKKERQLRALLTEIDSRIGREEFAKLRIRSTLEATRALVALPGVGLKSARCVLMYSLGRKVFPVDTHCRRVMSRLGVIRFERLTDPVQNSIQELVPPSIRYDLHVNFVAHGRAVCTARSPRCSACPLKARCAYFAAAEASQLASASRG